MCKKYISSFLFSLVIASGLRSEAQTPTPFSTASTNYVYVGAAGLNASTQPTKILTAATASTPSFGSAVNVSGTAQKLNGFGICQQDGFLYGMTFPNAAATNQSALYRVGSNGVSTVVGSLQSPAIPGASFGYINTTAGMVDAAGTYWFMAYVYMGNPNVVPYSASELRLYLGKVSGVNLLLAGNTSSLGVVYTEYNFSGDAAFTAGMQSFLNNFNYANPAASNGGMEDIALRQSDGKFYSYFSYPNPAAPSTLVHRPVVFNPSIFVLETVGTTINSAPNREIAGSYFDAAGAFYVLFTNGQYGQVNLNTGALGTLTTTTLPLVSSNLRGDLCSNVDAVPADPIPTGD